MKYLILLLSFVFNLQSNFAQNTPKYAVELAAFDQSVPLSYFNEVKNVYETYDVNQIYRYHIAVSNKNEADLVLALVKKQGFPNARIIDFAYMRELCKAQCGYVPPKRTAIEEIPVSVSAKQNLINNTTSINASDLLGVAAEKIPESLQDEAWLLFYEKYKNLGFGEEFLYQIYKTFGESIEIDKAVWFKFLEKNKHLGATEEELFEFFIKHGSIDISQADWFVYEDGDDNNFRRWLIFKEKNKTLKANDTELLQLYNKHGNIVISQAIWFTFKEEQKDNGKDLTIVKTGDWTKALEKPSRIETIGFILFEFGGTQPTENAFDELNKLVKALKKNENLKVVLIGHADAIGDASKNKVLSVRRAKRVQQYLLQKGIPIQQTQVEGKGEESPIAINSNLDGSDSPLGRSYNRRVDLVVTDPDGNPVQIVSLIVVPNNLKYKD